MGNLPSGTVTFLFTDIEGSTKLARTHPDVWETARARHHSILKSAIESNNGYIFQVIGDAFCLAFHNAGDALKAAIKAQQDLQNEVWGDVEIRVRMGIHIGEAEVQPDGQYQGYLALSQVQRIMSAGHGGQVLLSGATENLLRGGLPEGVHLLDLGRHNFKDVPQAVRVFQVDAPDLQRDFPPLRTFDILPNNLPAQLTSFVGREKELEDVKRLLKDTHMLTLIGPGGTGKTRLSIQAANDVLSQYPDGVWLVDLAPILDPLLVPRTTAITIGLRDEPKRLVIDMLCDYLGRKKMLIILDNCEHLVNACAQMADRILHAAPEVQILAGSREALGIAGEVTYRVPSLKVPDMDHLPPIESLSQYEAVKLFIDRATAAIPDFKVTNENAPALAQVCHRLDGIPLAIELAAGKIRVLSVEQIAQRLDDRFRLLTGGSRTAMERHQTLRAAVDWSYNLLPLEEQLLFKRLSVFLGGWMLEAAEAVCGIETKSGGISSDDVLALLEGLVNKSLVITEEEHGESRYRMLETIRQYANEKLVESGESDTLRDKHLEYFLNLAETAEPHLIRHEQLEWFARLDADYENIRKALEFSLNLDRVEPKLNFCKYMDWYWRTRGYWQEGLNWCTRALSNLSQLENHSEKSARAGALQTCAQLEWQLGKFEQILSPAQESLVLATQVSDKKGIAIARYLVGVALRGKDNKQAISLMEQSFDDFRTLNEEFQQASSYKNVFGGLTQQTKLRGYDLVTTNLELARKTGERLTLADALIDYANWLVIHNQIEKAKKFAEESDKLYKQVGAENINLNSIYFAEIAWAEGDYTKAKSILEELRDRASLLGEKAYRLVCGAWLGLITMAEGDLDKARIFFAESLALSQEIGFKPFIAWRLIELGTLFYLQGKIKEFKQNVEEGLSMRDSFTEGHKVYIIMIVLGALYVQKPENAGRLLGTINRSNEEYDFLIGSIPRQYCDPAEIHVRKALGDEAFESAFAEGQKMSLDEALDLVLKSLEEDE